uniref:Secreted protein n=1 Tax=Heterorhabditis bacteriophora TaxID=37862 RepID=A0A1I7W7F0_HETBA
MDGKEVVAGSRSRAPSLAGIFFYHIVMALWCRSYEGGFAAQDRFHSRTERRLHFFARLLTNLVRSNAPPQFASKQLLVHEEASWINMAKSFT